MGHYRVSPAAVMYNLYLTQWRLKIMAHILQTSFLKNEFSWMKMFDYILLNFLWNLFLSIQLWTSYRWLSYWLGPEQVANHYLNQWWPCLFTDASPGPCFNIKAIFSGMGISIIKINRPWDCLVFKMGIPILIRLHADINSLAPWRF